MNNKNSKNGIKAAILTMSFVQMATNGIAAILSNISNEFSKASTATIQFLMTFPSLTIIVISILSAYLSKYISKKILVIIGLSLVAISGVTSWMFHQSLLLLFVWGGILGIGVGLVSAIAISLISDYFNGTEKTSLMGMQTSAANMGSMLMTLCGGMLAEISWHYNYLVYLLAIPGLIFTICFLPNVHMNVKAGSKKVKIEGFTWFYCIIAMVFMLVFYIGPTNIAMFISQENMGKASTAGIAVTVFLFGGVVAGMIFGKIAKIIGQKTIPLSFIILGLGFILMYLSKSIFIFCIGCLAAGGSISFIMPQCMCQVSKNKDSSAITIAMALVMAFSNAGTFLAPFLTQVANFVMKSDCAKDRLIFTAGISVILASIIWCILIRKGKK